MRNSVFYKNWTKNLAMSFIRNSCWDFPTNLTISLRNTFANSSMDFFRKYHRNSFTDFFQTPTWDSDIFFRDWFRNSVWNSSQNSPGSSSKKKIWHVLLQLFLLVLFQSFLQKFSYKFFKWILSENIPGFIWEIPIRFLLENAIGCFFQKLFRRCFKEVSLGFL